MAAPPEPGPTRPPTSAAAQWLGPAVALSDAGIGAGLIWFAALIGALRAGAAAFGLAMTATAMLGAWQAASVRGRAEAPRPSAGIEGVSAPPTLPRSHRLPAAALAGAVGFAGVLDTRLAGAVVGAALLASFIVVGALRPRCPVAAASAEPTPPLPILVGAGLLIRTWMQVGVTAACSAAVARYSLGGALVLVSAAAAYDAGAHLSAAGRSPGLQGPLVGAVAAAVAVFGLTGLSVPPFAPSDALTFGVLAAVTLPLGPAVARPNTALAARRGQAPSEAPDSAVRADAGAAWAALGWHERIWRRMTGEWAVRRLDSLSVAALAWMWGLGLLAI